MFESAELGHKVAKKVYDEEVPLLREQLLQAQFELSESSTFQTFIIISGVDGAGKGETIKTLNAWMDPRHIRTNVMLKPSAEELERPDMWRFWQVFPPKGKIGIFVHTWYSQALLDRVYGISTNSQLDQHLERIEKFERMLVNEGVLILKFWLHLSKNGQQERFKALEKDPKNSWRVTERDWKHLKLYDKFIRVTERTLRRTSTAEAPWIILEGADSRYRELTIGKAILQALNQRLSAPKNHATTLPVKVTVAKSDNLSVLRSLDLSQTLDKKKYGSMLAKYQGKLALLAREPGFKKISATAVFEGFDAAGKGGSIRRLTGALDPGLYRVIPIAAPTEEEKAQPYLWRFWRHLPRQGMITIFDRSWYGRVLVERIEGFCSESDWVRAYEEINDFEEQLIDNRTLVAKFWLSISPEEQLARFKAREQTGYKRFKITEEDWRNREKFQLYEQAVCDMVDHTSTEIAPWTLIEANDKNLARIKVLRTFCELIEKAL